MEEDEENQEETLDNDEEEEEFEDEEDYEEKEGKDLFNTPILDKILESPEIIIDSQKSANLHGQNKKIQNFFSPAEEMDNKIHPGFISSYSFGEKEFERLFLILTRLDQVSEHVLTFRKENASSFPEYFASVSNLYYNLRFLLNTENRKKIQEGLDYVMQAVISFNTTKKLPTEAIFVIKEIHALLINLKNFHNLGISYEKKKGDSEKYYGRLFGNKTGR